MIKCFLTLFLVSLVSCNEFVPYLTWTNMEELSCKRPIQFHGAMNIQHITKEHYKKCLAPGKPNKLLIFLADQLTVEDFTYFGRNEKSFEKTKNFIKSDSSSLTASVKPIQDLKSIQSYLPSADVEVVNLKIDRSTFDSLTTSIQQMDDIVWEKLNNIGGKYVAVLTTDATHSVLGSPSERHVRIRRQSEADNKTSDVLIKGPCVFMKYSDIMLTINVKRHVMVPDSNSTQVGNCTDGNNTLILSLKSKDDASIKAKVRYNHLVW
uniref:uncharacterized protein LOC101242403 isoform X2 n=1 Tax=Ciona intestinalis TaxID=7719 RepID=UPI000EF46FE2|nr:uncharacterized protein LOC101242403 isoform X2 [Ciona intestinalis]|eukprot:XP_026690247.1 uncharacterized protein LOC101242403 isoform X2 [Ciona intestinalis]